MLNFSAPDLTQHPPRSPRFRLAGYVHLPRLLDKARAHAAGKLGDYKWKCQLDQRFIAFNGVDLDALLAEVKPGRTDTEMAAWVLANSQPARAPWEIEAWSAWMANLTPGDASRHKIFADAITELAPAREDIRTFFDRLDLDDYATFGGRP